MEQSNGNSIVLQGRIVWGLGRTLFAGQQKKNMQTGQLITGQNGEPVLEYGFGLAIPKVNPQTGQTNEEYAKVWEALHKEAFTLYPSGQLPPNFAMKYKDGDGVDHNGKPFADREGYKGHLVLACTTRIPIKWFIFQGGQNVMVNDGIKVGDYVNVQLNIKAHPAAGAAKAGLYLNPNAVQLIQPGKEIISSPSGDQMFGQAPPAYVGEVVAPVAPAAMPQVTPAPVAQGVIDPHYGVLPQQYQQPQAAPAMPDMIQPAPQYQQPQAAPAMPSMPQMPGAVG